MIKAAGYCGNMDLADKVYEEGLTNYSKNEFLHNKFIIMAGRNNCFDLAKKAYRNALESGIDSKKIYCSIITAAGMNGKFEVALEAYRLAEKNGKLDFITHCAMICAAGKNKKNNMAYALYLEVANKKPTLELHSAIMDILVRNGDFEKATTIYKNNLKQIKLKILAANVYDYGYDYKIDLHGYSYGSAYIALKEYLKECLATNIIPNILIVTGKRVDSKKTKDDDATAAIKEAVKNLHKEFKSFFDFSEVENNSGCFVLSKTKAPISISTYTLSESKNAPVAASIPEVDDWTQILTPEPIPPKWSPKATSSLANKYKSHQPQVKSIDDKKVKTPDAEEGWSTMRGRKGKK